MNQANFGTQAWIDLFNEASSASFSRPTRMAEWEPALAVRFIFVDLPTPPRGYHFTELVAPTGHRRLTLDLEAEAVLRTTIRAFHSWAGQRYMDLFRRRYYLDFEVEPVAALHSFVAEHFMTALAGTCPDWPSFTSDMSALFSTSPQTSS